MLVIIVYAIFYFETNSFQRKEEKIFHGFSVFTGCCFFFFFVLNKKMRKKKLSINHLKYN